MSIISCVPLAGSFIGGAMIPRIYHQHLIKNDLSNAFGSSFAVGFIVCVICFCLCILTYILDRKTEYEDGKKVKLIESTK